MADKIRLASSDIRPLAEMVQDWLLTGHPRLGRNVRCEIAGSLRREQKIVGDVEIVIEPLYETDLFGTPLFTSPALDSAIERCISAGLLAWDTKTPRNGPRYKRFIVVELGVPLDLFITREINWGNILAIRTGDAEFSRLLVTRRAKSGLMPNWMRQGDGYLHARAKGYPDFEAEPEINDYWENVLPCSTEEAFFRYLCLEVPPMRLRTAAGARQLSLQAVANQQKVLADQQKVLADQQKALADQTKAQVAHV